MVLSPCLDDTDSRTEIGNRATPAERIHGTTNVLPPCDEIQVHDGPPTPGHDSIEGMLGFLRCPCRHPSKPVRYPVHVRIDADVLAAPVGKDQDEIRGL